MESPGKNDTFRARRYTNSIKALAPTPEAQKKLIQSIIELGEETLRYDFTRKTSRDWEREENRRNWEAWRCYIQKHPVLPKKDETAFMLFYAEMTGFIEAATCFGGFLKTDEEKTVKLRELVTLCVEKHRHGLSPQAALYKWITAAGGVFLMTMAAGFPPNPPMIPVRFHLAWMSERLRPDSWGIVTRNLNEVVRAWACLLDETEREALLRDYRDRIKGLSSAEWGYEALKFLLVEYLGRGRIRLVQPDDPLEEEKTSLPLDATPGHIKARIKDIIRNICRHARRETERKTGTPMTAGEVAYHLSIILSYLKIQTPVKKRGYSVYHLRNIFRGQ